LITSRGVVIAPVSAPTRNNAVSHIPTQTRGLVGLTVRLNTSNMKKTKTQQFIFYEILITLKSRFPSPKFFSVKMENNTRYKCLDTSM